MRIREVFRTTGLTPAMAAGLLGFHLAGVSAPERQIYRFMWKMDEFVSSRDLGSIRNWV